MGSIQQSRIKILVSVILVGGFIYMLTQTSVYRADVVHRAKFQRARRQQQQQESRHSNNGTFSPEPRKTSTDAGAPSSHNIRNSTDIIISGQQRQNSGSNSIAQVTKTLIGVMSPTTTSTMSITTVELLSSTISTSTTTAAERTNSQSGSMAVLSRVTTTDPLNTTTEEPDLPGSCPKVPPGTVGKWIPRMEITEWAVLEDRHPELQAGGRWRPTDCIPRSKVAILIPYRDRFEHLHIFMNNMHDFLQRQQLEYGMYVIEQAGTAFFNRAKLFNVGFKEAQLDNKWGCSVFHDVDHIPLNDQNLYTCPKLPRHLSVAVEKFRFKMPYNTYFGGVSMMKTEHYKKINGMSNVYWGWGGEDDDFYNRVASKKLVPILRYPGKIGAYTTIQRFHKRARVNPDRIKQLGGWRFRQGKDGLNDLNYKVLKKDYRKLFTHIIVDIGRMSQR